MEDAYCPECGAGSIFNGVSGGTPCWLCPACGHQWLVSVSAMNKSHALRWPIRGLGTFQQPGVTGHRPRAGQGSNSISGSAWGSGTGGSLASSRPS